VFYGTTIKSFYSGLVLSVLFFILFGYSTVKSISLFSSISISRQFWSVLLFVISPLFLGILVYALEESAPISAIVRNFLPDYLWAFALISAFSIIWNNKVPYYWWAILALSFAGWEYGQDIGLLSGTGDPIDLIAYGLGWLTSSLIISKSFQS
jgi:hypothetical protein